MKKQEEQQSVLAPGELSALVKDLQHTRRGPGCVKIAFFTFATLALMGCALAQSHTLFFVLFGTAAGFTFASFMILTHDAIHHTLTGNRFIDEIVPRLMSWPLIWAHGTYSAIHKLHHNMNGRDEHDPERVHLTTEEYSKAGTLKKLIARHQLLFRVLVAGGFGMIINLFLSCRPFYKKSSILRRQIKLDLVGILLANVCMYAVAFHYGYALKLFALWLIFERTVGGVQQLRSHVEHYGLWNFYPNFLESQIYNTRNIRAGSVASFFFNGLNFHSVHHAFPNIPFYNLKEAHGRIKAYCDKKGAPLREDESYARVVFAIVKSPKFVTPLKQKRVYEMSS